MASEVATPMLNQFLIQSCPSQRLVANQDPVCPSTDILLGKKRRILNFSRVFVQK